MTHDAVTILCSLVSIFLFAILMFWLYREFILDRFRQKMFALRDELFDSASKGDISFSDPAYRIMRQTTNGIIRFGHRMNLPFVLSLMVLYTTDGQGAPQSLGRQLEKAMSGLSPEQRKLIETYKEKMNFLMVEYLVLNSIIFVLSVIVPLFFMHEAKRHTSKVVYIARKPLDHIDSVAYATAEA